MFTKFEFLKAEARQEEEEGLGDSCPPVDQRVSRMRATGDGSSRWGSCSELIGLNSFMVSQSELKREI